MAREHSRANSGMVCIRGTEEVRLRGVEDHDLPTFFRHQNDPVASRQARFTSRDPSDRTAFESHWAKLLADPNVRVRTVLYGGHVAGYVASWVDATWLGRPEVTYWIGREYWGRRVATRALSLFLSNTEKRRPIYGRAARDNVASVRVLLRCGFKMIGSETVFAESRGLRVEEVHLELR